MENTDNIKLFADNAPSIIAFDPNDNSITISTREQASFTTQAIGHTAAATVGTMPPTAATVASLVTSFASTFATLPPTVPPIASTLVSSFPATIPPIASTLVSSFPATIPPIASTLVSSFPATIPPTAPATAATAATLRPVVGTAILASHITIPKNMLGEFVYLNSESKVSGIDLVFYGELSESSSIEFDIFRMYIDGTLSQSDQKYEEEEDIEYSILSITNTNSYCGRISLSTIDSNVLKKQHKLSLTVNSFDTYLVNVNEAKLLNIESGQYSCVYSEYKIKIKTTPNFGGSETLEFTFRIFINSRNSTSSERYIVPISKESLFYCYKSGGIIKSGKLESALPNEYVDDNLMIISFGYGEGKYNAEFLDNIKLLYTVNHRIIDLIAPNAISIFVEKANEVKTTDFVYVTDYVYVSDNKVNYDKDLVYSNTEITSGEYNYAIKGSFSSDKFPYNVAIQLPEDYEDSIIYTEMVEPFENTDYKTDIAVPDAYNLASNSLMYAKLDEIVKISTDTTKIMKIKLNKDYIGGLISINNKDGNALRVRTDKKVSISPNFVGSNNKEDLKKEVSYKFAKNENPVKEKNKSRSGRSLDMENTDNIKLFADNAPSIIAFDPNDNSITISTRGKESYTTIPSTYASSPMPSTMMSTFPVYATTGYPLATVPLASTLASTVPLASTLASTIPPTVPPTVPPIATTVYNSKFKIKYSIIDSAITHRTEMLDKVHSINTTLPLSTIDKSLYPFETDKTQLVYMSEISEKPSNIQILNPITHLNIVLIIDKINNKFYVLFEDSDNRLFKYEFSGIYNLSIASIIGTVLDNDGFSFEDSDKNIYDITLSESGVHIRDDYDLSYVYYSAIYDLI